MIILRNLVSGGTLTLPDAEAADVLDHPWFSKFYIIDNPDWAEWLTTPVPQPVSDWIPDPEHPGYLMQS